MFVFSNAEAKSNEGKILTQNKKQKWPYLYVKVIVTMVERTVSISTYIQGRVK